MKEKLKVISTSFLLSTCISLYAQIETGYLNYAIDSIFSKYKVSTGPGCAVAIVDNGKVILQKNYGFADLEHNVPVSNGTIFHIASVSKQFTGLAISLLIEQKKLSLDDEIHKFIPELPNYGFPVKIRNLLHHTSGIVDCYDALTTAGWRWEDRFTFKDILTIAQKLKRLNFEPRAQYRYCNTEYALLQEITQRITGLPFSKWMSINIFQPLGMQSSHFMDDYMEYIPNRALHYSFTDGMVKKDQQLDSGMPMFSNIDDLSKWVIHFHERIDARDPVYLRLIEDDTLQNGKPVHYGLGLILGIDLGVPTVMHPGGWGGYRAVIRNYLSENLSVIILNNGGDNDINYGYSFQIANLFLKNKFITEKPALIDPMTTQPTVRPNSTIIKKYAGTYRLGDGAYTISLDSGNLYTEYMFQGKQKMQARSDSSFWVPAYNTLVTFSRNNSDGATIMKIRGNQAIRIIRVLPGNKELLSYEGIYSNAELLAEYKVTLHNGQLALMNSRRGSTTLLPHPVFKDLFVSDWGTISFTRKNEGIIGFEVNNITFHKTSSSSP